MEIIQRFLPVHYMPPMTILAGESYVPARPERLPPAPEPPQHAQPEDAAASLIQEPLQHAQPDFAVAGLPHGQPLVSQEEQQGPQAPASPSHHSTAQDDAQSQSALQEPEEWDCVD